VKYATWKLKFVDDYGYGPEELARQHDCTIEGALTGSSIQESILGYVFGELPLESFEQFDLTIVDQTEALAFAQTLDPTYSFDSNGRLVSEEITN
jgi:hypothetical protein